MKQMQMYFLDTDATLEKQTKFMYRHPDFVFITLQKKKYFVCC